MRTSKGLGIALILLLWVAPSGASTINIISVVNNSTCLHSQTNNSGSQSAWNSGACSNPGGTFSDSQAFSVSSANGGISSNIVGPGSASTTFGINAGVSSDDYSSNSFVRG